YSSLIGEVTPFDGASDLITGLKARGLTVVLASSAKQDEVEHYVEMLEAGDLHDGVTSAADVDATKPDPDLIHAAIDKAGGGNLVMVGDSVWDIEAANRAGVDTVAVLSGGFGEAELTGAGAKLVVESVGDVGASLNLA